MLNFYISAFLADLALGTVLLSLPLLLIYRFDVTSLVLGLLGALGAIVYSSGVIVSGRFADRLDRKKMIISGCLLFIAVYSVVPFLRSVGEVFFIYIFGSLSMSLFWPSLQSWLSQGLNKEKLVASLSRFNVCWSAGLTVGFLSAGILFSLSYRAPFFLAALIMAIAIFFLRRQPLLSEITDKAARKVFLETEKDRPESAEKFLYAAWCANFMSWYLLGIVRNLFPKLCADLGFSSSFIGFFLFLMIVTQTAMFFVLGRTRQWHYRFTPIALFQIGAVFALLMVSFTSQPFYFIAAMIFMGLSGGMTYFSSIFYSLYGFVDKGKRSGIHEAFIGTGSFFGPFIGGLTASYFGIRAPYVSAAFLVAAAIALEAAILSPIRPLKFGRKEV